MRMRRPRPSTLVCRSFDGFLAALLLAELLLLLVLVVTAVVGVVLVVEEEDSKVLDCMEMEPMKGPWPAGT